jgi:hypothetical protein
VGSLKCPRARHVDGIGQLASPPIFLLLRHAHNNFN